jgi:hypothetical protein
MADVPQSRPVVEAALLRPLDNGLKRKAHETCVKCHQYYLVEQNPVGVCCYYPCKSLDASIQFLGSSFAYTYPSPNQRVKKWTTTMISGQTTMMVSAILNTLTS